MSSADSARDRSRYYAARSRAESTTRSYVRDFRYFEAWCAAHDLASLPAEPRTVALFLVAHVDEWRPARMKSARNAIAAAHVDARHDDPTKDFAVRDLSAAITRMARNSPPTAGPEPLLVEDLATVCAAPLRPAGVASSVIPLRMRVAAVLIRHHGADAKQLVRIARDGIDRSDGALRVTLPETTVNYRTVLERIVELPYDADSHDLSGLLDALTSQLPGEVSHPLCFGATGGFRAVSFREGVNLLQQQAKLAARRARVARYERLSDLGELTAEEFERFLAHCDPRAHLSLRAQAMSAVGFALALRPGELRRLQVADIAAVAGGFDVTVVRIKHNPGRLPVTKALHHWPGCPPHCPACLLAKWLAESEVTSGALFPASANGGRLTERVMTDGALKYVMRRVEEGAKLDKHVSPKALRSGYVTSAAGRGAETEEIMAVTDHASEDVMRKHYVLTRCGATHRLGQPPTSRTG